MNKANIIEIFSSIQGEGPYIGYRQIFLRFAGCNLSCKYCDTEFNYSEFSNIENFPGSGIFKQLKNPLDTDILVQEIKNLNKINHHSLSLTGGEPLLSSDFLKEFLPELKKNIKNLKIYLETNGTLSEELEKVISYTDIISMDIKLKSSTGKILPIYEHTKFIETVVKNNKELFIKIVISSKLTDEEISQIIEIIKTYNNLTLVLQPVSAGDNNLLVSPEKLLEVQNKFLSDINNIRVIPQIHKFLNVL